MYDKTIQCCRLAGMPSSRPMVGSMVTESCIATVLMIDAIVSTATSATHRGFDNGKSSVEVVAFTATDSSPYSTCCATPAFSISLALFIFAPFLSLLLAIIDTPYTGQRENYQRSSRQHILRDTCAFNTTTTATLGNPAMR